MTDGIRAAGEDEDRTIDSMINLLCNRVLIPAPDEDDEERALIDPVANRLVNRVIAAYDEDGDEDDKAPVIDPLIDRMIARVIAAGTAGPEQQYNHRH